MNNFLKTYRLALTPLSPIHIGCGEDFDPTGYVIEDGILYGFDPGRAVLSDLQRSKLMTAANSGNWLDISRFLRDNAPAFKMHAAFMIPVSSGVARQYKDKLGTVASRESGGRNVINKLELERTQYSAVTMRPYIPGSSFKGAIRTAWLDELNREQIPGDIRTRHNGESESSSGMEKRLLKGDMETSPLRLLRIADLMPTPGLEPERRVMYAVNLKKREIIKDGHEVPGKGVPARKEMILHGQYRAFRADAVLQFLENHADPKITPDISMRIDGLQKIARMSNAYHLIRLRDELGVMDGRGMVNPVWKQRLDALLAGDLGQRLNSGQAFLIRLGRYGGAESKTLSGEGVARIKIRGAKDQPPTFESTTKTFWLAAENVGDRKHLLPFGWAVVEIDPEEDLPQLRSWCEAESAGRPDMGNLARQFEEERSAARELKRKIAAEAAAREAARAADAAAAAQRSLALEAMSDQGRLIESLRQKCEDLDVRIAKGNFRKQKADVGQAGLYQDADRLARAALEGPNWSAEDRKALADMLETWLPKVVGPWNTKEQRKKLRLSALRGL